MKNETIGYVYNSRTVISSKYEGYAVLRYAPKIPTMQNVSTEGKNEKT
jgi:hypothetical protein